MARVGIVFGLLLCGLTLFGLVTTMAKSPLQFVPMMLGVPVLFCGVVGLNPHRRKHAMYVAAGIALFGTIVGSAQSLTGTLNWNRLGESNQHAFNLVVAMTGLSATLFVICTVSFIGELRRKRALIANGSSRSIQVDRSAPRETRSADARSRESA